MNMKKILIGGISGGVAFFLLGWLCYGILFKDLMAAGAGSAPGVERTDEEMNLAAIFIGNLMWGFLFSVVFSWSKHDGLMSGLFMGAVVGFLMNAGSDFIMYGTSNLMTLNGALTDILVGTILATLAGGVTGWAMGMIKE